MLSFSDGRRVAVMEGDKAVALTENLLRITHMSIDYIREEAAVIMHKCIQRADGIVEVSNPSPVTVSIRNEKAQKKVPLVNKAGAVDYVDIPERNLFDQLIGTGEGAWIGDVSQLDIEAIIIDNDLLHYMDIADVVPQAAKVNNKEIT